MNFRFEAVYRASSSPRRSCLALLGSARCRLVRAARAHSSGNCFGCADMWRALRLFSPPSPGSERARQWNRRATDAPDSSAQTRCRPSRLRRIYLPYATHLRGGIAPSQRPACRSTPRSLCEVHPQFSRKPTLLPIPLFCEIRRKGKRSRAPNRQARRRMNAR